jgi:predicted cupin superfamily sugar epimerase
MHPTAAALRARHELKPHPEGGWYRELFRDPVQVLHPTKGTPRAALTHILFLLEGHDFSAFHRVAQTELWQYLEGAPLELTVVTPRAPDGGNVVSQVTLGPGAAAVVAHAVPPFALQAARSLGEATLCGCTVAPGFTFEDFELPSRAALLAELPGHAALVHAFTR